MFASMKDKSKETRKEKYGLDVNSPTQIPEIRQKQIESTFINHGVYSFLEKEDIRNLGLNKQEELYGVKYFLQSKEFDDHREEHLQKQYKTNQGRYGGITPSSDPKVIQKQWDTKKKNGTFNSSKPEERLYDLLKAICPNTLRQYYDDRYPFRCDFYIPEIDLFIEYNGTWTHGFEPFDSSKKEHLERLEKLLNKIEKRKTQNKDYKYFKIALEVWTNSDPLKLQTASSNKLNYLVLWNWKDVERLLKDDIDIFFTHEACVNELNRIKKIAPSYDKGPFWNEVILTYQKHFYKHERNIWKDDLGQRLLLLANRTFYLKKQIKNISDYELLRGFKISGLHYGYSHMSPFYIKKFIQDYSIKSIYDPFGGWGQRLLGTGDMSYIYNDIDFRSCEGVRNIIKDFNLQNKIVYNKDASKFTPEEDYEAVFTCSPYFNLEKYDNLGITNTNNYEEFLAFWRDVISHSLKNSVKYFCFVIDEKNKKAMSDICIKDFNLILLEDNILGNRKESHFTKDKKKNFEYLLIFSR